MISVIVPIYNEEKILTQNSLQFQNISKKTELIFVDGESTDRSMEIASRWGRIVRSEKGRARQMNCGAYAARGNILFFLHADTFVSPATLASIENKLKNNEFIGGCLTQRLDKEAFIYRVIESFGNIRARLSKTFYGDQGIFVRKDVFLKIGGFPRVPIMEDVLFSKKLRRFGKTIILPDKIFVSSRRWEKKGIIRTVFLHSLLSILFRMKIPLSQISSRYGDLR